MLEVGFYAWSRQNREEPSYIIPLSMAITIIGNSQGVGTEGGWTSKYTTIIWGGGGDYPLYLPHIYGIGSEYYHTRLY